ncbi:hypothetical protein CLAIMM_02476 [Cladophialophora immunda]|nr:hypothetical protein CLAIMM_02476 [Cladophialophora immunda]
MNRRATTATPHVRKLTAKCGPLVRLQSIPVTNVSIFGSNLTWGATNQILFPSNPFITASFASPSSKDDLLRCSVPLTCPLKVYSEKLAVALQKARFLSVLSVLSTTCPVTSSERSAKPLKEGMWSSGAPIHTSPHP